MKKTILNILVILVVVGITFGATRQWFPKTVDNTVVDTVEVEVPYEVEKIKEVEKPIRVTEYKTEYDTVETVRVEKDTVFVETNLDTFTYNTRFLTNYPESPRFLGLTFENPDLELTYQKPDGNVRSKRWNVGNKGYEIGLDGSQPNIRTFSSPKPQFEHSIEAGYIRFFKYGSLYFEVSTEFTILGIETVGTANINQNPFGKVGIKHNF